MPDSRPADRTEAAAHVAPAAPVAGDWPAQAADTIVRVVGQVRDKTAGPAITAARGVVYGVLAALLGVTCAVLLAIMLVRLLDNYLVGENNTWLAHLLVGGLFSVAGLFLLFVKTKPRDEV
jgi:hypothetical protein